MMRIGFQGWFLNKPYTGIGQHSLGLLKALSQKKGVEIYVLVPAPVKIKGVDPSHVKVLEPAFWLIHPALRKWYWERIQVPAYFAKLELDWEYYPYPSPLSSIGPHLRAVTVHDMILWKDPRVPKNRLKKAYLKQARRSLVYADLVFTVSQTVHDDLGLPVAVVLPNGAPEIPQKLPQPPKLPREQALVYLGGYEVRKQVPLLMDVFQNLKDSSFRLLLIGEPPHKSAYYPSLPNSPGTIRLGALTDDKVYSVLKSSFAFIHLSDAEGFNIPLLQAMQSGIPAIVRDIPVNREVSAGTALFLPDTNDTGSLTARLSAILKQLRDPTFRKTQIAAQKKVAQSYSWQKTTKKFLATLTDYGTD